MSVEVPAPELIGSADGGDLPVKDHLLRRLLLEYHHNCELPAGWHSSAILFIDTMVADRSRGVPTGRVKSHHVLVRPLHQRQLPGNHWEVYSDKTTVRELLDASRALSARGGGYALRWLTESALEAPASVSLADLVARRASPAPVSTGPTGLMARQQGHAVVGAGTGWCSRRRTTMTTCRWTAQTRTIW